MNWQRIARRSAAGLALGLAGAAAHASLGGHAGYPHIPEPMVFDMIRPLGAPKGELETNVLGTAPLAESDRVTEWAPEAEYTFADGLAVEFEFPFADDRLTEYKLGLQGTLGTFDQGRSVHGLQYLGIYERAHGRYQHTLLYLLGHRYSARWSSMSMFGLADISGAQSRHRNDLLVNHALFYDLTERSVLGLEINYRDGHEGQVRLMPQVHYRLTHAVNLQFGLGLNQLHGESARPEAGLRLVREF